MFGDISDGLGAEASTQDNPLDSLLSAEEERERLEELAELRDEMDEALDGYREIDLDSIPDGDVRERLARLSSRYHQRRKELAMSQTRLVMHIRKRFRNRGISDADLLQEGFCGLMEAIDRFTLDHTTRLVAYASWYIGQAMQKAVAGGAYPVRLTPRNLRQVTRDRAGIRSEKGAHDRISSETMQRLHAATRPAISLDHSDSGVTNRSKLTQFDRAQVERERDELKDVVGRLMHVLRPREREVVSLRFGLGVDEEMSLSEVGSILSISKERVRQIQDQALAKLRFSAEKHQYDAAFLA